MADQEPSAIQQNRGPGTRSPAEAFAHTPPAAPERDGSEIWPPAARTFTAVMVLVCLTLLLWRGYGLSRWSARPAAITRDGWVSPIDLNQAGVADLRTIPGIGEVLAGRIVEHREQNGPFRQIDELRRVPGVGPAVLAGLRPYLRVGRPAATAARVVRAARPDLPAPPARSGKKAVPQGKIDVNRAGAEELRTLPGIGPAMAGRILDARAKQPFISVEDLRRVKGIGVKTLDKLRPYVEVGSGQ